MAKTTITVGGILVAVGVIGWVASGAASWTALIPAIIGAVVAALGWLALTRPKLGVHAALVVALLGLLGTVPNVLLVPDLFAGTTDVPLAVVSSVVTFAVLLVYLVLGVRSFVAVRRERASA